jgi:hypothetical protein
MGRGRLKYRIQIYRIHPQINQVIQFVYDSLNITTIPTQLGIIIEIALVFYFPRLKFIPVGYPRYYLPLNLLIVRQVPSSVSMVGSLLLSPLRNRSGKIWYQIALYAQPGDFTISSDRLV